MNPAYRELILKGGATPVSKLSGAFLDPPTPMHLQFAYYESSMVVQYVLDRFGTAALERILADLGADVPINAALARHTEPIEKLDESFAAWLRGKAEAAAEADLKQPELDLDAGSAAMAAFNKANPANFWGLLGEGRALLAEPQIRGGEATAEGGGRVVPRLRRRGRAVAAAGGGAPRVGGDEGRARDAGEARRAQRRGRRAADAPRRTGGRGEGVEGRARSAEQVLAVNPLAPAPHRELARAAEALGDRAAAIEAHRTLLLLDPLDAPQHRYELAKQLAADGKLADARREIVRSLEEAPRFRAAHELLLDIVRKSGETDVATTRPATGRQPQRPQEPRPASQRTPAPTPPAGAPATTEAP